MYSSSPADIVFLSLRALLSEWGDKEMSLGASSIHAIEEAGLLTPALMYVTTNSIWKNRHSTDV